MDTHARHIGKYILQERLGQGGMAEVWKALDTQLQRYVAIKFLHPGLRTTPDFINRFIREGQAIASLHHPNIVQVHDLQVTTSEQSESTAYMVMDYINGPTLAEYMRHTSRIGQSLSPYELIKLTSPISLAIDYAHQHGIIHRDIKPANILLDRRNIRNDPIGEPILTDFGIVKMVGSTTLTESGTSLGTPLYISPEIIQGLPGSEKSDIYSFGVMLYELCTGMPPFRGDSFYTIMLQHIQSNPKPPSTINPSLPRSVDQVILRCLAKKPEARFNSAVEVVAALAHAFTLPIPDAINNISATNKTDSIPSTLSQEKIYPLPPQADDHFPSEVIVENRETIIVPRPDQISTPAPMQELTALSGNIALPDDTAKRPAIVTGLTQRVGIPAATPGTNAGHPAPSVTMRKSHARTQRTSVLITATTFVLLISIVGASLFFLNRARGIGPAPQTTTTITSMVGQAIFTNSGKVNSQGMQDYNDRIEVQLSQIPAPHTGNRYYAWLRNGQEEGASIYLGSLKVDHGQATLTYTDPAHRNLLNIMSTFLVTEESASFTPTVPSIDQGQWRYSATLPDTPSTTNNPHHFGELDHLRHLLSEDPNMASLGLHGGIDTWFQSSMIDLQGAASVVKTGNNLQEVRQQITDVLYLLNGPCAQQIVQNTAGPQSPETPHLQVETRIGFLNCAQRPIPGYLVHIGEHLDGIVNSPGATQTQKTRAVQIEQDINLMQSPITKANNDAKQLVQMNDQQLEQALNLRNDLFIQASIAFNGTIGSNTSTPQRSVTTICTEIQKLAQFEVQSFHSPSQSTQ
jgi:eukaryotic-like serine/threonine-protein kinase